MVAVSHCLCRSILYSVVRLKLSCVFVIMHAGRLETKVDCIFGWVFFFPFVGVSYSCDVWYFHLWNVTDACKHQRNHQISHYDFNQKHLKHNYDVRITPHSKSAYLIYLDARLSLSLISSPHTHTHNSFFANVPKSSIHDNYHPKNERQQRRRWQ